MSMVVHERASDGAGVAGARLACFPLEVPTHWKYQPAPAG